MSYATQLDLEQNYGVNKVTRLADFDRDGAADVDVITEALEFASSIIDAHLSIRFAVPVTPVTRVVRDLCVDIALYRLAHDELKRTVEMRQRYEDAIDLLKRIAEGKASIGQDVDGDGQSDIIGGEFTSAVGFLKRG